MERTGYWGCSGHGWRNKSVLRHERAGPPASPERLAMAGREGLSELEGESRSWVAGKKPVKMRGIVTSVSEIYQPSAPR